MILPTVGAELILAPLCRKHMKSIQLAADQVEAHLCGSVLRAAQSVSIPSESEMRSVSVIVEQALIVTDKGGKGSTRQCHTACSTCMRRWGIPLTPKNKGTLD